jgi:Zn-dependent peptidase ImmA (M78 family)/transcriptional regulator with XRE-family HTH domain
MSPLKIDSKELAERASYARLAAGFSLSEAAMLLGFKNYQTLSDIEKGKRKLNANELSAMAHHYKRSLDYFFGTEVEKDLKPLWRKLGDCKVESVQMQLQSFLENYSKLEDLLDLKRRWKDIQKNFEKLDFFTQGIYLAGKLGDDTWSFLDLGSRPAFNLLNVLENDLRFKILHLPLLTESGISGASVVDDKLGVGILINASDAPWRRNFDLAHELFHVVTWKVFTHEEVGDGSVKTRPEKYADAFASSLLLPEKHLKKSIDEIITGKKIRIVDIIELAKDFGVSTEAILWRLVNLKIVNRKSVEELLHDESFRENDRQLRKGLYYSDQTNKFPSRYISLACRCLMDGKISRGTFAEYMEIKRHEVDDFLVEEGFMDKHYEKIAFA